ncbi:glycoside hydrolase family protein [Puniceicoccus vermicola]|uniref:Uncharacterized protein n=1 Tax=Puniceicoccus vermicola TaxID=388746 RepID=A0A7X1E5F5_9BACT|nr:hypothetical protein [Puniceicoccus vermicola]MBC2602973.1 hypothetical protein [Puniceicoccus vermicola]
MPDDSVLLIYKSAKDQLGRLHLGALRADHYTGPYYRVSEEPILEFDNGGHIEDPFIWREDGRFRMLIKDMTGSISGCERGGIEGESEDGITWQLTRRGYNREIQWSDGSKTLQNFVERPSLILDTQGKPSHFCAATAIGSDLVQGITESWNMVIPLG